MTPNQAVQWLTILDLASKSDRLRSLANMAMEKLASATLVDIEAPQPVMIVEPDEEKHSKKGSK